MITFIPVLVVVYYATMFVAKKDCNYLHGFLNNLLVLVSLIALSEIIESMYKGNILNKVQFTIAFIAYIIISIILIIFGIVLTNKENKKNEYDTYSNELLTRIKREGILVQTMPKGTEFLFDEKTQYKKDLGAIPIRNIFGNITNVYVAYEDFDGSLKYYDYPQYSKRDIKKRKEYEI